MRYRERLLVHWTGKREMTDSLHPIPEERKKILNLLLSILEHGLWLTVDKDELCGGEVKTPWDAGEGIYPQPDESHTKKVGKRRIAKIKYHPETYRCCFTEVPLRTAIHHAKRYGSLGIGVDRKFVLDRWGAPVHYVRNHFDEVLVWQHAKLHTFLEYINAHPPSGLEEEAEQALRAHNYLLQFLKCMSNYNQDTFSYLEENEWRIVWTRSKVAKKIEEIGKQIRDDKRNIETVRHFLNETSKEPPRYVIPIKKQDVKVVVFPDEETRRLAIEDISFKKWLHESPHIPQPYLLTINELPIFEPYEP